MRGTGRPRTPRSRRPPGHSAGTGARVFHIGRIGARLTAREYFEAAYAAQRHIDAACARIRAMREREGIRSRGFEASRGGGGADPMRLTDARMDAEAAARSELAALEAEVCEAREVCRGIRSANPRHPYWGDCIELHYLDHMTWHQIGSALGVSTSHARRSAYAALDWVDMVGIAAAREGAGGA